VLLDTIKHIDTLRELSCRMVTSDAGHSGGNGSNSVPADALI
jgi:hypothetical protein